MRKIAVAVITVVAVLALLTSDREASACERCGFHLDCESNPDCDLIPYCKEAFYPNAGFEDCTSTTTTCTTSNNPCQWASVLQPSESDLSALISGETSSSLRLKKQCRVTAL